MIQWQIYNKKEACHARGFSEFVAFVEDTLGVSDDGNIAPVFKLLFPELALTKSCRLIIEVYIFCFVICIAICFMWSFLSLICDNCSSVPDLTSACSKREIMQPNFSWSILLVFSENWHDKQNRSDAVCWEMWHILLVVKYCICHLFLCLKCTDKSCINIAAIRFSQSN